MLKSSRFHPANWSWTEAVARGAVPADLLVLLDQWEAAGHAWGPCSTATAV